MNKVEKFKELVKINRKSLADVFSVNTVNSWIYGNRIPTYENAKIISDLLNMSLADVPYYRKEHVI